MLQYVTVNYLPWCPKLNALDPEVGQWWWNSSPLGLWISFTLTINLLETRCSIVQIKMQRSVRWWHGFAWHQAVKDFTHDPAVRMAACLTSWSRCKMEVYFNRQPDLKRMFSAASWLTESAAVVRLTRPRVVDDATLLLSFGDDTEWGRWVDSPAGMELFNPGMLIGEDDSDNDVLQVQQQADSSVVRIIFPEDVFKWPYTSPVSRCGFISKFLLLIFLLSDWTLTLFCLWSHSNCCHSLTNPIILWSHGLALLETPTSPNLTAAGQALWLLPTFVNPALIPTRPNYFQHFVPLLSLILDHLCFSAVAKNVTGNGTRIHLVEAAPRNEDRSSLPFLQDGVCCKWPTSSPTARGLVTAHPVPDQSSSIFINPTIQTPIQFWSGVQEASCAHRTRVRGKHTLGS